MKTRSAFIKSVQQNLIFILVMLTSILVESHIEKDYLTSVSFIIDAFLLIIVGVIFISEIVLYILAKNNSETKEESDIIDEDLDDAVQSGSGKKMIDYQSLILRGFALIVLLQLILHVLGVRDM